MLALIDCNACYASCEQIYRPDLRGKPVVVLSNNDGCIVARNKEAKALNIPDLEPYFKIKHLLKQQQVNVFSSNYELYGDTSARTMELLSTFGTGIEIYSIDEAFLNVSGMPELLSHGHTIKKACWRVQRMPVSVGMARTKTLAKLANHIAKKSQRLDGVCLIEDTSAWSNVFRKLPVSEVWGIGSRLSVQLAGHGIHSIQDLITQPSKRIRREFGVVLERTHAELNGTPCINLDIHPVPRKEIICSRSFSQKITERTEIRASVANYAARAAEKLRRQNSLARYVYVMLQSSRFKEPYYRNSAGICMAYPTNDTRHIIQTAMTLTENIYRPGIPYAKAGVGLLDLQDGSAQQQDLFTKGQSERSQGTMQLLDKINRNYGSGTLFIASQGTQRQWDMARHIKSPAYTTRFSDIPTIRL